MVLYSFRYVLDNVSTSLSHFGQIAKRLDVGPMHLRSHLGLGWKVSCSSLRYVDGAM